MSKPPRSMGNAKIGKKPVKGNKRLTAQTRKILGKHYANKYRTGRE